MQFNLFNYLFSQIVYDFIYGESPFPASGLYSGHLDQLYCHIWRAARAAAINSG